MWWETKRLCGDRDKTTNHIISKCSKLAQKAYKIRQDWMVKVIHWELCKKLKFDQKNKWYIRNPQSVLKNETHKVLWNFEIKTDPLISARRPDKVIISKKMVDFAIPVDHRIKLEESEKRDKYLDLARELKKNKKLWNMKGTVIPSVTGTLGTIPEWLVKGLETWK